MPLQCLWSYFDSLESCSIRSRCGQHPGPWTHQRKLPRVPVLSSMYVTQLNCENSTVVNVTQFMAASWQSCRPPFARSTAFKAPLAETGEMAGAAPVLRLSETSTRLLLAKSSIVVSQSYIRQISNKTKVSNRNNTSRNPQCRIRALPSQPRKRISQKSHLNRPKWPR